MATKALKSAAILILTCLLTVGVRAQDNPKPLSADDVVLLLIGGASTERILELIEERGVDFRMTPDLAQKFHNAGADDMVIEALQKASARPKTSASVAPAKGTPKEEQVKAEEDSPSAASEPAPSEVKAKSGAGLTDPSPGEIERIIQAFAAKEKLFKEARDNYTYHQINKVQQLDSEGSTVGVFQQEWDIVYDDNGERIERVTYAPPDTLKGLLVTREDLESMRKIQPFVLTTEELPEYDIKYLGHVKVDHITAYVFSIRPKEIKKERLYFQGTVWVDDRDLQIVKSEGKTVPEQKTKKGENLFPRFTTYREQIDGKFWFPTFTMADDTLYFAMGPIRIKQIIKYTDYKQFRSTTRVRMLAEVPPGEAAGGQKEASKEKK